MDRFDELAIFVAIIDEGSLTGAARRLRRSAPAVTRALAALEDRVAARLVERTTRRLSPTAAGRELAERARAILGDYDAALLGASEMPIRGLLRVTAPVLFGRRHVAPVVNGFLDSFPETQVELVLQDSNLDLVEEGLDVAVRIDHLADSALLVRRVGEVRRVAVASPGYIEEHGRPMHPRDLAQHSTIASARVAREWRFGPTRRGPVVRIAPRLLANEMEAQLLAVRAGRGIARVLSYQVADELAQGTLVRLLPEFEPPPIPVQILARSGGHMAPKVRAFLDYAYTALRKLDAVRGPV
ncbi:LysR family transcriptional regulator [Mesorhizobium sp. L-8-10]|uniref:LysR family transcriptional regulator n=1 Tax=Mesorhizobium sp. L-8-10 TaxID=2744523 RepID=UPI0019282E5E|nr:LysR family transcriptional regulator [Mesorhizobium sp. L-8-10]BCH34163.1 LysR family transcriptional regulator [Mesorhizobium sp. L-8-10]